MEMIREQEAVLKGERFRLAIAPRRRDKTAAALDALLPAVLERAFRGEL
jgi:hypothetical protein